MLMLDAAISNDKDETPRDTGLSIKEPERARLRVRQLNMLWTTSVVVVLLIILRGVYAAANNVSYDHRSLILHGKRQILLSGSVHYPRATPEMWPEIIAKAKQGGLDVIETYVFWDQHEPSPGTYFFEGRYDLVKFVKLVQEAGLYANLRIGPYACAEWNFGGFPIWLRDIPDIVFRTNNEPFQERMQSFLSRIVEMMRHERLFASQGGPIILAQVENEYGNVEYAYGEEGKKYVTWAGQMAQAQNTGVPWIMCQQSGAPEYIINTCNGMYCDGWTPDAPNKPTMWTESYTGWFSSYGWYKPHRPVEDIAFAVARFFEFGGSFHNYYMYFGGTNFGRTSGGPYVATSYDYDAPIDEYGLIRQPKWGHLRDLHLALKLGEETMLNNEPYHLELGPKQEAHVYSSASMNNGCVAFLANIDSSNDTRVNFNSRVYDLPAWSVSILPDCKNVVFNTAKVNAQSAVITMKGTESNSVMHWESYDEPVGVWGRSIKARRLLEQIHTTQDTTDYLWYTTSVQVTDDNLSSAAIYMASMRDVVHIFVNGEHSGTWRTNISQLYLQVVQPIKLHPGANKIAILSVTVGLQNFGPFIEKWDAGINGSIILKGLPSGDQDLTLHDWTYQVGLKGESLKLYTKEGSQSVNWSSSPSKHRPLIWYKTEFDAPVNEQPVALDLGSMGKGQAWVNGESIGRFWPAYEAPETGCSDTCDYRGTYDNNKCLTGCGEPSQRWYHVPRSWLKPTGNRLVLFEEIGGDPSGISVVTRSVDSICAQVSELNPPPISKASSSQAELTLQCPDGYHISHITFASFGTPEGTCGRFQRGSCHAEKSLSIVDKACVGSESCSLVVAWDKFGADPCPNVGKTLAVEAVCAL